MRHVNLIGVLALALALSLCAPAGAVVLSEDFNDDGTGVLTGNTANTGQTWATVPWSGHPDRDPLETGAQYGQGDNGAGNENAGETFAWKASQIPLGEVLNDGTVVASADFKKQHVTGGQEMSLVMKSSTQNKETALIWGSDWLKIGGSWNYGGGQINTGVPTDLHVELTLNLVDGGVNTAAISFEEIGNPGNNGSLVLGGSHVGTLNYDTFEIWGYTKNGKIVGFDNISVVGTPPSVLIGDMDDSGAVNNNDISPFVMALTDRPTYIATYGLDPDEVGDIDGSGQLNNNDITPFVNLLTGAPQAVPEPATLSLLALGGLAMLRRRE